MYFAVATAVGVRLSRRWSPLWPWKRMKALSFCFGFVLQLDLVKGMKQEYIQKTSYFTSVSFLQKASSFSLILRSLLLIQNCLSSFHYWFIIKCQDPSLQKTYPDIERELLQFRKGNKHLLSVQKIFKIVLSSCPYDWHGKSTKSLWMDPYSSHLLAFFHFDFFPPL